MSLPEFLRWLPESALNNPVIISLLCMFLIAWKVVDTQSKQRKSGDSNTTKRRGRSNGKIR